MAIANTTILIKKSPISGNTPSSLANGEIAINQVDGKLFYSTPAGSVGYITNQQSFATINANSSLILASSPSDILNIVAGNNISISACTSTKTITISSTASGSSGPTTADITYEEFTATEGQTTFTVTDGYIVEKIAVYLNGVLLNSTDYTATNGSTVVLTSSASLGDLITISKWSVDIYVTSSLETRTIVLNDVTISSSNTTTTTNSANQILDLVSTTSYRSVKYLIQVTSGSDYQTSEIMMLHNGSDAFISEYGLVYTGSLLMDYYADVSGGNARLLMSPINNINTINVYKTYTKI